MYSDEVFLMVRNVKTSTGELGMSDGSSGNGSSVSDSLELSSRSLSYGSRRMTFVGQNGNNPVPENAEMILKVENALKRALT